LSSSDDVDDVDDDVVDVIAFDCDFLPLDLLVLGVVFGTTIIRIMVQSSRLI
jgi:hypothetical protein